MDKINEKREKEKVNEERERSLAVPAELGTMPVCQASVKHVGCGELTHAFCRVTATPTIASGDNRPRHWTFLLCMNCCIMALGIPPSPLITDALIKTIIF